MRRLSIFQAARNASCGEMLTVSVELRRDAHMVEKLTFDRQSVGHIRDELKSLRKHIANIDHGEQLLEIDTIIDVAHAMAEAKLFELGWSGR
jgi:hypothetical protein